MRRGLKKESGIKLHVLMRKRAYGLLSALEKGSDAVGGVCLMRFGYRSCCRTVEGFLMVSERHVRLLAARCIGRRNDYALQQDNGRYVRVGSAVSLDAFSRHIAGVETMGSYVIDEQDTCHFA